MVESYLPVLVFLALGTIVGVAFTTLNRVLGPQQPQPVKSEPYECGLPSDVQRGFRFGISFYLIAMLFILFDVEVIFLYPVAVHLKAAGAFVLVETADLRRAAGRRLRLRVAQRSARVEVKREKVVGSDDLRARQLRARDLLRGDSRRPAPTSTQYVEERRADHDAREGAQLGALERALARHLRPRLLRDRDDVDRHRRATTARGSAPRCSAPRRARPTC